MWFQLLRYRSQLLSPKRVCWIFFCWIAFTSDHQTFYSLFKVRRHVIGCINNDIVISLCSELRLRLSYYIHPRYGTTSTTLPTITSTITLRNSTTTATATTYYLKTTTSTTTAANSTTTTATTSTTTPCEKSDRRK